MYVPSALYKRKYHPFIRTAMMLILQRKLCTRLQCTFYIFRSVESVILSERVFVDTVKATFSFSVIHSQSYITMKLQIRSMSCCTI